MVISDFPPATPLTEWHDAYYYKLGKFLCNAYKTLGFRQTQEHNISIDAPSPANTFPRVSDLYFVYLFLISGTFQCRESQAIIFAPH